MVCRWRQNLSIRQAAQKCGVPPSTYYYYEKHQSWPVGMLHKMDPDTYDANDEEL